jgi:uncharacterized repeat protein (TIGR03803 family)
MRRSLLSVFLILPLAVVVWPVKSVDAQAASSGKIIYSFQGGADGEYPYSDLAIDAAGNLYGTTSQGGIDCGGYGCGTVFELAHTKDGWTHQVLHKFASTSLRSSPDGSYPTAGVVFDSSGNLYGTTESGGKSGCGTVFKLAPNSNGGWQESILYAFGCNPDGRQPNGDLVFDSQGNLYGTTFGGGTGTGFCGGSDSAFFGCGTAFRLSLNPDGSWSETTIYNFQGSPDAAIPVDALVPDGKGGFYGASEYGGAGPCSTGHGEFDPPDGCSAVFELTPSGAGWTESVIYSFFRGRGFARNPSGGFIVGGPNVLFGASSSGGNGFGSIFRLEDSGKGWNQDILHRFYGDPDGRGPVGRLAKGSQNTWFGVTRSGGANRDGTVFALISTKAGWEERVLFNFESGPDFPEAGPAVDSQGHVYGTTLEGGSKSYGSVYEVIP